MDYTIEQVRELSQKLEMSYNNAMNLCFYEEILERMASFPMKEETWLKEDRKKIARLVYYTRELNAFQLKEAMSDVLKTKKNQDYEIVWDLWIQDDQLEIVMEIHFQKLRIPFKIIFRPLWDKEGFPTDEFYTSPLNPKKEIPFKKYPVDLELAEFLYEIIDKLELIGTMEPYGRIWNIISDIPVDGRHVSTALSDLLLDAPIPSLKKRWETVLSYRKYGYMKKRWNNYCKAVKIQQPSWEELIDLLEHFFSPVWRAVVKDEIFMGDWMPHLGRYL